MILAERQTEEGPVIRAAGSGRPENAKIVSPSLEDAFLYLYREEPNENREEGVSK